MHPLSLRRGETEAAAAICSVPPAQPGQPSSFWLTNRGVVAICFLVLEPGVFFHRLRRRTSPRLCER